MEIPQIIQQPVLNKNYFKAGYPIRISSGDSGNVLHYGLISGCNSECLYYTTELNNHIDNRVLRIEDIIAGKVNIEVLE